jgi:hypothetical protein
VRNRKQIVILELRSYVDVTRNYLPVVSVGDDGTIDFSGGVRHDVEE